MQPILVGKSRHAAGVARSLKGELALLDVSTSLSKVQETVARMFGHRDWHGLQAASKDRPASPPDEEVGKAEAEARRDRFVETLSSDFRLTTAAAAKVVDAIRPTGRRKPPAAPRPAGYTALDAAILGGGKMHVFRSGGGLRVVRIEKAGKLIGYGEAPYLRDALALCEDDTGAGGRPYGTVYGKIVPHYITGAHPAEDEVDPADEWVFQGHGLDAWRKGKEVVVSLTESRSYHAPEELVKAVLETGKPVECEARGMRYRVLPGHAEGWWSIQCIDKGDGTRDPNFFDVAKVGRGSGLREALNAALAAPEEEVVRPAR